jgi:hypothetical protein
MRRGHHTSRVLRAMGAGAAERPVSEDVSEDAAEESVDIEPA